MARNKAFVTLSTALLRSPAVWCFSLLSSSTSTKYSSLPSQKAATKQIRVDGIAPSPAVFISTALPAVTYMPDGSVQSEFYPECSDDDWTADSASPSNLLLDHLNRPDLRASLAILAAARESIDIATIEYVKVVTITDSVIDVEVLCSREDMHCVNVLCSISLPVCDTDLDKLDFLSELHQQASVILDQREYKTGTVVSFNPGRGFGFIATEDGSDDVYVHHSNICMEGFRKLRVGQGVEFKTGTDTTRGTGRLFAFNVRDKSMANAQPNDKASVENEFYLQDPFDRDGFTHQIGVDPTQTAQGDKADMSNKNKIVQEDNRFDGITDTTEDQRNDVPVETDKPDRAEATNEKHLNELLGSNQQLEETAFNILLDLGMISITPDPDSPDYDTCKDDEFAPENVYLQKM